MTTDPRTGRRFFARTDPRHWKNLTAKDIPPGWIDDMVKRLFEELNRQMLRFEHLGTTAEVDVNGGNTDKNLPIDRKAREKELTPAQREQDGRTLARMEGTLTRLTKLEMQRASLRATTKKARGKGETRGSVIDQIMAGPASRGTAPKTGENS